MKFGRELQTAAEALPDSYRSNVLSYKKLKKMLRAIVEDMEGQGVSPEVLRSMQHTLLAGGPSTLSSLPQSNGMELLRLMDHASMSPRATSCSDLPNHIPGIEALGSASMQRAPPSLDAEYCQDEQGRVRLDEIDGGDTSGGLHGPRIAYVLDHLADKMNAAMEATAAPAVDVRIINEFNSYLVIVVDEVTQPLCKPFHEAPKDCEEGSTNFTRGTITIPLRSDASFFQYLTNALKEVAGFQQSHLMDHFHQEFDCLIRQIGDLTKTECKDYKIWRGIVKAYLESDMFMTLSMQLKQVQQISETLNRFEHAIEQAFRKPGFNFEHLSIASTQPQVYQQLINSQDKATAEPKSLSVQLRSALARHFAALIPSRRGFRDRRSWDVYSRFLALNHELLGLKQMSELNETAVRKILKKHDKKTQLPSRELWLAFHAGENAAAARSGAFTRALVSQLNGTLTTITPLVDSHACPICADLLYPAVRLRECGHAFCYPCGYRLALEASVPDFTRATELPPAVPPTHVRDMPPHLLFAVYGASLPARCMRCPLCRAETTINRNNAIKALLEAEDVNQSRMLKKEFPDEARAKKKAWVAMREQQQMDLFSLVCSPWSS